MVVPTLRVDRSSPVPLYFQVAEQLQAAIESGELPTGSRLDNEIQLASTLGLSRPTMRQAIQYLVDQGLLVRKRGVGTEVVANRVRRAVELTSLYDDLTAAGQAPTTSVLSLENLLADDAVAHHLQVEPGAAVVRLRRLRYAQGEPLALLTNYLPDTLVKLSVEELEKAGLYELLKASGIRLTTASQTIGAKNASASEAAALGESRRAALLTMSRVAYDERGTPVEYGHHLYRASRYSFSVSVATS
ncbi:GntR family transcriptional regulator [Fodinicola acaciae]|uniref:GntR family transcriptional regulator n=1 Tax=Fodinicola acaciae TaxID=2681555 RepID=UPI0013D4CB0D|nr:GntR family transcriptional regulator [Fodinicola acaciae]